MSPIDPNSPLDAHALDQLFLTARTQQGWLDRPVPSELLQRVYDVAKMAPTAANSQPMRVVFVQSPEAKARLKPTLSPGNVAKTMAAPATAIVAFDTAFYENFPRLFPAAPAMRDSTAAKPEAERNAMALQSATLQGAYLILAARALGLDCGPMAGFSNAAVDAEFFADGAWKSCFLINLGYGDPAKVYPRAARLAFEEACRIL